MDTVVYRHATSTQTCYLRSYNLCSIGKIFGTVCRKLHDQRSICCKCTSTRNAYEHDE